MASYLRSALTKAKAESVRILSNTSSSSSSSSSVGDAGAAGAAGAAAASEVPSLFHEQMPHESATVEEEQQVKEDKVNDQEEHQHEQEADVPSRADSAHEITPVALPEDLSVDQTSDQDVLNQEDPQSILEANETQEQQHEEKPTSDPSTQPEVTADRFQVTFGQGPNDPQETPPVSLMHKHLPLSDQPENCWATIDVLLQPDGFGFGLLLGFDPNQRALVLQSFRRRHGKDLGPAEACGRLQAGDVLLSIDGERMRSLRQMHSTLERIQQQVRHQQTSRFVLFQFRRRLRSAPESTPDGWMMAQDDKRGPTTGPLNDNEDPNGFLSSLSLSQLLGDRSQVTLLLHDLVKRNELLKKQLVESRMKLAERTRQLKELQTEFHRSEMESRRRSSSSLPFRRNSRSSSNLGGKRQALTLTPKEEQLLEKAIVEERQRVATQLAEQFDLEKVQLTKRFQTELRQFKQQMIKKQEMLETGFAAAVDYLTAQPKAEDCSPHREARDCRCHALLHLRRELNDHVRHTRIDDSSANLEGDRDDSGVVEKKPPSSSRVAMACVVCDLLHEVKALIHQEGSAALRSSSSSCGGHTACNGDHGTEDKRSSESRVNTLTTNQMEDIRHFLQEYKALQCKRKLDESQSLLLLPVSHNTP